MRCAAAQPHPGTGARRARFARMVVLVELSVAFKLGPADAAVVPEQERKVRWHVMFSGCPACLMEFGTCLAARAQVNDQPQARCASIGRLDSGQAAHCIAHSLVGGGPANPPRARRRWVDRCMSTW